MESYYNEFSKDLLKKRASDLLDIELEFGGDITKSNHYKSITCVDFLYTNMKEFKKKLGTKKKIKSSTNKNRTFKKVQKVHNNIIMFFLHYIY